MTAQQTYDAGMALLEAAAVERRVEANLSEARVAKLKAVAELERAGRMDDARKLLDEVRAEQEACGL